MADTCISAKKSIRRAMNDVGPNLRVVDKEIYRYMTIGQQQILKARPDASDDMDDTASAVGTVTSCGDAASLSVHEAWTATVENYVLAQIYSGHAQMAQPNLAAHHQKLFNSQLRY